jgi:hypothetical protein
MIASLLARILDQITGTKRSTATDMREAMGAEGPSLLDGDRRRELPARVLQVARQAEIATTFHEHEDMVFSSNGQIHTADGRSLDFSFDLAMCRDFSCQRTASVLEKVVLRDPLLINFDGQAAELSGARFAFDLDTDGHPEAMAALASHSGYLAIDKNGDGRINDGSELFGSLSGDGFADLAKFDQDGNRWLDQADAIFDSLRVWQHGEDGKGTLATLREKGVGALYLGAAISPFSLTDSNDRVLGQIRASGIYLREDGSAGSLQQIDLAI